MVLKPDFGILNSFLIEEIAGGSRRFVSLSVVCPLADSMDFRRSK
jgi:hypothetical protein